MEPHQECAYDHIVVYDGHTTESRHRELDQMELRRRAKIRSLLKIYKSFLEAKILMRLAIIPHSNGSGGKIISL